MENFMPKGVYDRNPVAAVAETTAPEPVKMLAMKLERHYRPLGAYEVVGYLKKAVTKKFPDGLIKIIEPEEFIPGEQAPAPFPGVVSTGKVWAQTTIKLPEDEAKSIAKLGIASRDFDD
jgi:hypothetical protein